MKATNKFYVPVRTIWHCLSLYFYGNSAKGVQWSGGWASTFQFLSGTIHSLECGVFTIRGRCWALGSLKSAGASEEAQRAWACARFMEPIPLIVARLRVFVDFCFGRPPFVATSKQPITPSCSRLWTHSPREQVYAMALHSAADVFAKMLFTIWFCLFVFLFCFLPASCALLLKQAATGWNHPPPRNLRMAARIRKGHRHLRRAPEY